MQLDDTLDSYIRKTSDFHGCFAKAPGVVIGCHMVEYALELLGESDGVLNAVVETRVCLADCVQVMTGCTLGNKALWLRDEIGKYALTLYDRVSKEGVRVYLDVTKIDRGRSPDLYAFHTRTRDPRVLTDMEVRKESGRRVVAQFLEVRRGCLSHERVRVLLPTKGPVHPSVPCERCGEPFLKSDGGPAVCATCRGGGYYEIQPDGPGVRRAGKGPPRRPCAV